MIKDIRAVEWEEGKGWKKHVQWDIQIMREGSRKWESVPFVRLKKKPEHVSRDGEK